MVGKEDVGKGNVRRRNAGWSGLVATLMLLGACTSQDPLVDTVEMERELTRVLGEIDRLPAGEVTCDRDVQFAVDAEFRCQADIAGETLHYDGVVLDSSGSFEGQFVEAIVVVDRVHDEIDKIMEANNIDATVSCSDRSHLIREVDRLIMCGLTDDAGEEVVMQLQVVSLEGEVRIASFQRPVEFGLQSETIVFDNPEQAIAEAFLAATGHKLDRVACAPATEDTSESDSPACLAYLGNQKLSYAVVFNDDGSLRSYEPQSAVIVVATVAERIEKELDNQNLVATVDCGESSLRFLDVGEKLECTLDAETEVGQVHAEVLDVYGTVVFQLAD